MPVPLETLLANGTVGPREIADRLPASPSAADQEWASLPAWTTLGALDTLNVTDMPGNLHMVKNATGAFQVHGIYQTLAALGLTMPFTATLKLTDYLLDANYQAYGLMLVEAGGAGKLFTFGAVRHSVNGFPAFSATFWTTRTARLSVNDYATIAVPIRYIRVRVNSSTSVDIPYSRYGLVWHTLATALNPGFTVAAVGIMVTGNDNSVNAEAAFGPMRFT